MADYRRNKRKTYRTQRAAFPWTWVLFGVFLGTLGTAVLFVLISNQSPIHRAQSKKLAATSHNQKLTQSKKTDAVSMHTKKIKKKPAQRFEFYQLLPGMEVPIPDNTKKTTATVINTHKATPSPQKPNTTATLTKTKPKTTASLKKKPKSLPPKNPIKVATKKNKKRPAVKIQKRIAAAQYLIQVGTYRKSDKATDLKTRLSSKHFSPHIQKVETESGTWFRVTLGPFSTEAVALQQKRRLEKQNIRGILILQR